MRARRVCLIGQAGNVHVQRWAQALVERGLRVSLISTAPLTVPLPPALRHLPCYTIPTASPAMRPHERLLTLLRGWGRVPGLVAALRPDLVQLHALPTPAAVPFLCRVGPLVVSAWGSDVVQRDRRKSQLYPALLAHADALTATSRYLAEVLATYLHRPRRIEVIAFGVDAERFRPPVTRSPQLRIGTLRHLERIYGIDLLVDAIPIINDNYPNLEVVIGGAGSQQQALTAQIARLGLPDQVRLYGRVPHAEVPAFLGALRIFAMPSRAESFGVAALEAQACGVPVVATRVGGLPEAVVEGVSGVLVLPDDASALAESLLRLLDDPQRAAAMGRAGRDWVRERYDWQHNVTQMLAVYEQVVSHERPHKRSGSMAGAILPDLRVE